MVQTLCGQARSRYYLYWFTNLSRCRKLVEATWSSIAVQTLAEKGICHGTETFKRAEERVTALKAPQTLFGAGTALQKL